MWKKSMSAGIILIICFLMAGCTGKTGHVDRSVPDGEITEESKDYIVVGYSQVGSESDYRIENTESVRETFTQKNGYYLLFEDAQQKQENQLKTIRNFILQEVDYIVLDPVVETGWEAVLQEAKDAGIPVILSDRSVEVEDENLYTCWVGSNFDEEGACAGKWLENYLASQGRTGEEIRIVTLQGTPGSTSQLGRTRGFQKVQERNGNWNMLERKSGDFTQAKGKEVMEEFLNKYQDIDVVVSENDNMTFGAIEAIKEAGKTCGPEGEIIIISFDCVQAALSAMKRGDINVDIECNPLLAPKIAEVIDKLKSGEKVEKVYYIEESYYDTSMDLDNIIRKRSYKKNKQSENNKTE